MRRLIIENKMDLLCLGEILNDYPKLLDKAGAKPSAISSKFIRDTFKKVNDILKCRNGCLQSECDYYNFHYENNCVIAEKDCIKLKRKGG